MGAVGRADGLDGNLGHAPKIGIDLDAATVGIGYHERQLGNEHVAGQALEKQLGSIRRRLLLIGATAGLLWAMVVVILISSQEL